MDIELKKIKKDPMYLQTAPLEVKNNEECVLFAIKKDKSIFQFASDELKQNREFIKKILAKDRAPGNFFYDIFPFIVHSLQMDKAFVLECIQLSPRVITHVKFKIDEPFIASAIKLNPFILALIPDEFKNITLVMLAISANPSLMKYAPLKFKKDESFIRDVIQLDAYHTLEFLTNKDEATFTGELIYYELARNKQLVMEAVSKHGSALQFTTPEFKQDRDIVLAAVRQNGFALEYASSEFLRDKEVVMIAVRQKGGALFHLGVLFNETLHYYSLAHDKDVVMSALTQDGNALEFVPPEFIEDRELVLAILRKTPSAIEFMEGSTLMKDPAFKAELLKIDDEDIQDFFENEEDKPVSLTEPTTDTRLIEDIQFKEPVVIVIMGHGKLLKPFETPVNIERHINTDLGITLVDVTESWVSVPKANVDKRQDVIIRDLSKSITEVVSDMHELVLTKCKENEFECSSSNFNKTPTLFIKGDYVVDKEISCTSYTRFGKPIMDTDQHIIIRYTNLQNEPSLYVLNEIKMTWTLEEIIEFAYNKGASKVILFDFSTMVSLVVPKLTRQLSVMKTNQQGEGTCYAHSYARIVLQNAIVSHYRFDMTKEDQDKFNENLCNNYAKTQSVLTKLKSIPDLEDLNEEKCSTAGYKKIILFLCLYFNIKKKYSCGTIYMLRGMFSSITIPEELSSNPRIVASLNEILPDINEHLSSIQMSIVEVFIKTISPVNLFSIVKQVTDLNLYVELSIEGHTLVIVGTHNDTYILKNSWSQQYDVVNMDLTTVSIVSPGGIETIPSHNLTFCIPCRDVFTVSSISRGPVKTIVNQFEIWLEKYRKTLFAPFAIDIILPNGSFFNVSITRKTPLSYLQLAVADYVGQNAKDIHFTCNGERVLFYSLISEIPKGPLRAIINYSKITQLTVERVPYLSKFHDITITIKPTDSIADVKREIEQSEQFLGPHEKIDRVVYDGNVLEDDVKLSDIVTDKKTLVVSVVQKGGMRYTRKKQKKIYKQIKQIKIQKKKTQRKIKEKEHENIDKLL